jgi:hypothetical protein
VHTVNLTFPEIVTSIMDNNLNISVPRIPVLPPPLDQALVLLQDSDRLDCVTIPDPLNYTNTPALILKKLATQSLL